MEDDDLLTEILIRLPDCQQVARCAAVCKRWSSLIGNTEFVRSFKDHHSSLDDADFSPWLAALLVFGSNHRSLGVGANTSLHVIRETPANRAGDYLSFLPWDNVAIKASCNDLLLVSRVSSAEGILLCVCNPTTKKYGHDIPKPPEINNMSGEKYALTCRDNGAHHSYHVTFFLEFYNYHDLKYHKLVMDFSSEIGRWSLPAPFHVSPDMQLKWPVTGHISSTFNTYVSCGDGLVYWTTGVRFWKWVAAFNPLATILPEGYKKYRLIPRPPEASNIQKIKYVRLGDYRGRLRAACITYDMVLRVWELIWSSDLRDNSASCRWSMVHNAALVMKARIFPIALHPGDRNVIFLLINEHVILRYDMSFRTSRTVGVFSKIPDIKIHLTAYPLCSTWPTPVHSLQ